MPRRTNSTEPRPRPPDSGPPETAHEARIRDLADRAARWTPDFPPVSDAQRDKLALILHPGGGPDDPR
jgi:hypothetical protein